MSLGLAAFFVSGGTGQARAQMMALPDSISVSETGGAIQSFPITVPPGTAGVVPSLSLTYNSQGQNGIVGMGFMLNGLASIGRCAKTPATDGVIDGVSFDADDRFCLDGQRLIAISGSYGADGTEYRTEIESFSKVVSHGSAGSGPAWFEVWTKSGQIMEFGRTNDSRILAEGKPEARIWSVNKIADTAGNYMRVRYVNDAANGQSFPDRIDYTGNDGAELAPYNSVRFVYDTNRPDAMIAYQAGSFTRTTALLTNIQTYTEDTLVSDYRFAYNTGPATGRMRLQSVTLCEGGGACLPATTIGWTSGSQGEFTKTAVSAEQKIALSHIAFVTGDFNGDGLTDFYTADPNKNGEIESVTRDHFVRLSNGDGTFATITVADDQKIALSHIAFVTGDFNGDGLTDFYTADPNTNGEIESVARDHFIHLSNGDGTFTKLTVSNDQKIAQAHKPFIVGDFNGDGLTDFFTANANDNGEVQGNSDGALVTVPLDQFVYLSNGDGTFERLTVADDQKIANAHAVFVTGEFNGDGLTDFYTADSNSNGEIESVTRNHFIHLSNGDGTFAKLTLADDQKIARLHRPFVVGDFNGDGLTDLYTANANDNGEIQGDSGSALGTLQLDHFVYLSSGDGTFEKLTVADDQKIADSHKAFIIGDFNGDGLTDFYTADPNKNGEIESVTREHFVRLSNGDGTFATISVADDQKIALSHRPFVSGDFNGDGLTDYYTADPNTNGEIESTTGDHFVRLSSGPVPDILTTVTNGLGAETAITYRPMTDKSVYTKDTGANAASYPVVEVISPMQITSRVELSDGIGGKRVSTYRYSGAKMDLTGRGFLGFRRMISRDEETGIEKTSVYEQYYPFTLMKKSETASLNGVTLSHTANSYDAENLGGTRKRVFLTQSVASGADLNGVALPSTTTTYQYDAFSNATRIIVTTSDGFSKTTTNSYSNDTANWLLGRLLSADVTSTAPDVVDQIPVEYRTPDAFDFNDVINAAPGRLYEDSALISGANRVMSASVSGGDARIRKNGGGAWAKSITINPGDTLNIRMTSGPAYGNVRRATVTVGGASADWRITVAPRNRTITISRNTNGFNLRTRHDSLFPPPVSGEATPITVTAIIKPGVTVGSASTAKPAFDVGLWPDDVKVTLKVQGRIQGAGGNGGPAGSNSSNTAAYAAGKDGGTALYTRNAMALDVSSGQIWGGGGGGAGGRIKKSNKQAGSGGGGAGQVPGKGGARGNGTSADNLGQPGTATAGGAGGLATTSNAFNGAAGGGPGLDGAGSGGSLSAPGGKAGLAIDGAGLITQTGTGDIRGPVNDGPSLSRACPNQAANGCLYDQPGGYVHELPAGVTRIRVTVVGAGGGLGTRDHSRWHAYGGAGGGAAIRTMSVKPGQFFILNVGQGGSSLSGWCKSCSGGNGGNSSFAGLSATGGQGGHRNGKSVVSSGGTGRGGNQNCTGGSGTVVRNGFASTGTAGACGGGAGGSSPDDGIGGSGGAASPIGGDGGSGVCGAGSGAFGVPGANGCVLVEWL